MEAERLFVSNHFFTKCVVLRTVLSVKPVHLAKRENQISDVQHLKSAVIPTNQNDSFNRFTRL